MSNHLENMARRLEDDPFFLACPLKHYAKSHGLNDEGLIAVMKCSREALVSVRLCRAPLSDADSFHEDIVRIATRFSVDADVLGKAVRMGQVLFQLSRPVERQATFLAARDDELGGEARKGDGA